ncbi:glutaminase liver isoform, mitochondrial isoform X3 [Halyomorpha halys]|uniref:glutaminase liver isoform, mitochondrial isoform X3 n=1 Tax=Halyomorpha halys TaxID=286706 RepID=UPI0006D514E0|nr:glutaminase liver isoform, mitochondrial-like isoform X3 [Halyomorpha halys]
MAQESAPRTKGFVKSKENVEALSAFFEKYAEKRKSITIGKMLEVFEDFGILPLEDPRMVEFMQFTSDKGGVLTKEEFIIAAGLTGELLIKAITGSLSITNFLEFKKALQNIFDICRCEDRGKVFFLTLATPKKNHDAWEAAFITINGRTAHFGDGEEKFTIQSAIKPIMYALAVELLGVDEVMKIVGMTYHCGRIDDVNAFNEKGIPKNANINTGGIALCSHIKHVGLKNKTKAQIFDYVVQFLKDLSGNKYVSFSNISYMAEKETISKNKSIIYYLKKKKCLAPNADLDDLDFYFAAMDHQYNLNMFYASSRLGKTTEEDKTVKVFKPCPWHCSLYAIATTGTAITLASTLTDDIKPCYTNFLGRNLLHDAAAAGNMQCVSFFMQACPHMLEKKDCLGFTPLDDAKFFKHDNVINYLEKWISLRTATPLPKKE